MKKIGKGQIISHSEKALLVIENDLGSPVAHILGPKRKSPKRIDADGFKRADGKAILLQKGWWKITDVSSADIWQIGEDFLIPVSLTVPVPDDHFGSYNLDESSNWEIELS